MSRISFRIWLGVMAAGFIPLCAQGQSLISDQPWSQVSIRGEVSISGVLPLSLDTLPPGMYRLTARGIGFPKTQARLRRTLDGRLETYALNGPESLLFPPGAAHLRHSDDRMRGLALLAAGGVSIAQGFIKNGKISQGNDDIVLHQNAYDNAVTEEEIRDARIALEVTAQEISDQEEMRTLWTAAAGYIWLGAALESWILTPTPSLESAPGGYRLNSSPASSGGAALRSILLPGGGQRYLGKTGRGNLYLAGVTLFGLGALYAQDVYLEKSRDQLSLQRQFDLATNQDAIDRLRDDLRNAQDDAQNAEITRWALVGLAAGTYVWNIIDAATLGSYAGDSEAVSLQVTPHGEGVRAQLNWRID